MRLPSLDKVAFLLSLAVLAWFYGFATSARQWFPNDLLVRAWNQAQAIVAPPRWTEPRVYHREGVRIAEPDEVQPGLNLIASYWRDFGWKPGLKLIDTRGRVIHEWRVDPTEVLSGSAERRPGRARDIKLERHVHGFHLFPNGDVLVNVDMAGTARLDACGHIRWRLPAGNHHYHHSIERADDGSFWIPASAHDRPADSPDHPDGLPGLDGPVHHDLLLRITEEGELLRQINVLELLYANGLERYIVKADQRRSKDIAHLNDVEPLSASMASAYPLFEAGDLLVSLRDLHLIFVVEPDSGRVKWHASEPLIAQHDPDFIGDGWIGVFDNNQDGTNRGTMLGGSRIVALQPHTGSREVPFPTPRSDPFYSGFMGQWQLLENGNMLLTESTAARVVEVAPDGRTVWEWVHEPYDESRVPWVTGATRYSVSLEEVASWPCAPTDSMANRKESAS